MNHFRTKAFSLKLTHYSKNKEHKSKMLKLNPRDMIHNKQVKQKHHITEKNPRKGFQHNGLP